MSIDPRLSSTLKSATITAETVIETFSSLLLIDAGADGFRLKTSDDNIIVIPTGVPISLGGTEGTLSAKITVMAPLSGSLNVSALYY